MRCQISPLSLSVPTNTGVRAGAKVISGLITSLSRNPYPVSAPLRFHLRRSAAPDRAAIHSYFSPVATASAICRLRNAFQIPILKCSLVNIHSTAIHEILLTNRVSNDGSEWRFLRISNKLTLPGLQRQTRFNQVSASKVVGRWSPRGGIRPQGRLP